MLALTRLQGESILIYPADNIDPYMTVSELFRDGSIKIYVSDI